MKKIRLRKKKQHTIRRKKIKIDDISQNVMYPMYTQANGWRLLTSEESGILRAVPGDLWQLRLLKLMMRIIYTGGGVSYSEEGPYVSAPIFVLSQFPSLSIQILASLTTTKNNWGFLCCFFFFTAFTVFCSPPPP